jgi:hypothetical protein
MASFPSRSLVVAVLDAGDDMLSSGTALATQGLEGRWEINAGDLVFDISQCGEQVCGQAVRSKKR